MTNTKKLAIFTISMSTGGAERVISLLLKHLKDDFNTTLVLFYDEINYEIPEEINTIILFPNKTKSNYFFLKARDMIIVAYKYYKLIKNKHIEVAISFLPRPNFINILISLKRKKLKTIISERNFPTNIYSFNKFTMILAKLFFPLLYNKADKLFSNSVHINKDLKDNFGIKIPMSVIYNPVECNASQKLNPNNIKSTHPLRVINVGAFEPKKDQKLIINAFNNLNPEGFYLTFLGSGSLENDLKNRANQLSLTNNINFNGQVKNVKDYLIDNDCFVLSSKTEGFPNVLLEAASVGLPIISTNCLSGPLELLNDNEDVIIAKGKFYKAKYGLLINTEDEIALTEALNYFKEHPEERKKYSTLGYERALNYSLLNIYTQVKDLIIN